MRDKRNPQIKNRNRRIVIMGLCVLMGLFVIFAFLSPGGSGYSGTGDAKAYVLENHTAETGADNAVTAVYLNYRLWDTLFEAMLLLLSAMAVISLSWRSENEE